MNAFSDQWRFFRILKIPTLKMFTHPDNVVSIKLNIINNKIISLYVTFSLY
jgi:hypothetical protein